MIKKQLVLVTILLLLFSTGTAMAASPITVDGSLQDWGLENLLTGSWSSESTWLPSSGITYMVVDNIDPQWSQVCSGPTGVHIYGTGSSYQRYYEPQYLIHGTTEWTCLPKGGEKYDLDALYFKQDANNIYLAVVTSLRPDVVGYHRSGDIALDTDGSGNTGIAPTFGYEYGIVTAEAPGYHTGFKQGDIIKDPVWQGVGELDPQNRPDIIIGGTVVGNLGSNFIYSNNWMTREDNGVPNYVIETAIPKTSIGMTAGQSMYRSQVYISENCMNDVIHLPVPELPTVAISIGLILGITFVIFNVRGKKKQ